LSPPQRDAPGAPLKGQTNVVEPDRIERAIGRRSAESRATVPDLELSIDIDAGPLLETAKREQASTTAILVAACAAALREFPRANAAYRDGHFELYSRVNVAVTLQSANSPVAATVLDADARSPAELDAELTRLRARALAGELTPPEQAGATFTLTDLGEYGIHRAAALITPPQAAALTAGAIRAVPVVRGGAVAAGQMLALTLVCDHRILFGAGAAGFLGAIAGRLERGG
jgi:pyruvate dehydrogenase E2 component (dihydrolipoamide acetyltransferase)